MPYHVRISCGAVGAAGFVYRPDAQYLYDEELGGPPVLAADLPTLAMPDQTVCPFPRLELVRLFARGARARIARVARLARSVALLKCLVLSLSVAKSFVQSKVHRCVAHCAFPRRCLGHHSSYTISPKQQCSEPVGYKLLKRKNLIN